MGEASGAAEQLQDGLSEFNTIKWHVTCRMVLGWLAEVHLLTRNMTGAMDSVEQALRFNTEEVIFQP
jgi:hypothetical protein